MRKRVLFLLLVFATLLFSAWISSHRDGQITIHVEAEPVQLIPDVETKIKVYVENLGPGKAGAFVEIRMPILDGAILDTPGIPTLMTYTVQSPWELISQRIEGDELVSVYGFGELTAGGETSYLITGWSLTNFRIVDGMCGNYSLEEIAALVKKICFQCTE